MLAIAGAILIHAACVLMTTNKDSFDIYAGQRLLAALGAFLLAVDLMNRTREFFRKARAQAGSTQSSNVA